MNRQKKYVNFVNEPTYHVFMWVTRSGVIDVPALVQRAFEQAQTRLDDVELLGVCAVVQEELEDLIREALSTVLGIYEFSDLSTGILGDIDEETVGRFGMCESFAQPLLLTALYQVYFDVVTQSILEEQGKWNPEEFVERFPLPGEETGQEAEN